MPALLEEGEEVLHCVLKTSTLRSYFSEREKWCLNNTWQASGELTAILPYLICPHKSLKRKMSEPKKHSFDFRKWGSLAFRLISHFFSMPLIFFSASLTSLFVLLDYMLLHHNLWVRISTLLSAKTHYMSQVLFELGGSFSSYKIVLACARHCLAGNLQW